MSRSNCQKRNGHAPAGSKFPVEGYAAAHPWKPVTVVDVYNLDRAAKELHCYRAQCINASGRYRNAIMCSAGPQVARLQARGIDVITVPIPRNVKPPDMFRGVRKLEQALKLVAPSILHSHGSTAGACARFASRRLGIPFVVHTVHGFHFHELMHPLLRRAYVEAERFLARFTDILLFQNEEDLEESNRYGIRARLGNLLVGNGIQLSRFAASTATPRHSPPVVLMIARFEPVKNHELLIRAARTLTRNGMTFELWFAGCGPSMGRCRALVRQFGLAERVRFLGYVDDVAPLLRQATVAVLPSLKEGIPRALMEPMASGVAVVATDVKGNRELISDGRTGILVPPANADALATAVQRLLTDEELHKRFTESALERVRKDFDEASVVQRLITLYDGLLDLSADPCKRNGNGHIRRNAINPGRATPELSLRAARDSTFIAPVHGSLAKQ